MKKTTIKDLKYYLSLNYPVVVRKDSEENVYVAEFPDLPGCIAHGETEHDAFKLAQKVKESWLELALSSGYGISEPKTEVEYSGRFSLRLPKELHKQLSEQASKEGRSLNQHIFILLSERSNAFDYKVAIEQLSNKIAVLQQTFESSLRAVGSEKQNFYAMRIGTRTSPVKIVSWKENVYN